MDKEWTKSTQSGQSFLTLSLEAAKRPKQSQQKEPMKGYQFLQNDFFNTCRKRKITKLPMLLLIYLRGLYAYYGKPTFFYKDHSIMKDLGITKNTLRQARKHLRERGVIDFYIYTGRGKATRYLMLEADLGPELKGSRFDRKESKSDPFSTHEKGQNLTPSINRDIKPSEYGLSIRSISTDAQKLLKKFKEELLAGNNKK